MVGGWQVATPRVVALEDRLTRLEATAPDTGYAARARTLRDAVRTSRVGMSALPATSDRSAVGQAITRSVAALEGALARTAPPGNPPPNTGNPPPGYPPRPPGNPPGP
jgi:hypothetical protein